MNNTIKDKVVLIGMPGCGKTTLGKVLASELIYNFYDMDSYIEQISKKTISELFLEGEEVFRAWETRACIELSKKKRAVISSGGGVVKKHKNIEILSEDCLILFINRPTAMIIEDVDASTRPLLKDGKKKIYQLYEERFMLYKEAAHIEINNIGFVKDTISIIKMKLKNRIKE